jgi:hypothetical protein
MSDAPSIWLRNNWPLWIRHDAHRFMAPDPNAYTSYATRLLAQRREEEIFGTNSDGPPTYTMRDQRSADAARDKAASQYPELRRKNLGWAPLDGFYHAESTILLRAARANGGSLEGRVLEIHVDDRMCNSCSDVLPILSRQLGNPTVSFVDKFGARRVLRDGRWD